MKFHELTDNQKIRYVIYCALIYPCLTFGETYPEWSSWAENWLNETDRSVGSAEAMMDFITLKMKPQNLKRWPESAVQARMATRAAAGSPVWAAIWASSGYAVKEVLDLDFIAGLFQ